MPIGKNPTDMAVHAGEGRLYVTNWGQPVTRVVDLASQTELAPLALGTDVYKVNAGRPGRIYVEGEDQWVYLSTINSASGASLNGTLVREGDGATDPTGHWYYHCDNNISNAHITRYDISGDTPVAGPVSAEHPYGSRSLVIAGDGSRLFWRGYVYNAALTETGYLGEEIYATTLHGEIAFGATARSTSRAVTTLAMLPVSSTVMAVSGDDAKLFYFDPFTHSVEDTVLERPTPAAIALVATDVGPDHVRITWHIAEPSGPLVVERAVDSEWSVVGTVTPDADGTILFEDKAVTPATTFRYRLSPSAASGSATTFGEVVVRTPEAPFALHGLSPNPATRAGHFAMRFSLPKQGKARLSIIDVQGRAVWDRTFPLGAGEHTVPIDAAQVPRPGVYFARLESLGQTATQRFIVLR